MDFDDTLHRRAGTGRPGVDEEGRHLLTFGGKGKGDGLTRTSHGFAIDTRFGDPRLLVCDRENRRVTHFDLEGNWIGV